MNSGALTALAIPLLLAACDMTVTRGHEDADTLRDALLIKTPIGSSIDSAGQVMEANGFVCSRSPDQPSAGVPTRKQVNGLHCTRTTISKFLVNRHWQTVHVDSAGRVREVNVTAYFATP